MKKQLDAQNSEIKQSRISTIKRKRTTYKVKGRCTGLIKALCIWRVNCKKIAGLETGKRKFFQVVRNLLWNDEVSKIYNKAHAILLTYFDI